MKLAVLSLFALVVVSMADTNFMGTAFKLCEEGTHAYMPGGSSGCGYRVPEPTCLEPNPVKEDAVICDYSACYCDSPTVRDPATNKCVLLEECS